MNIGLKLSSILVLLALSLPAGALELFGVQLESTARDELRDAAKNAGLVLIREGGEDNWFDLYDSTTVLEGSRRLYLGFVKKDQRFAFAEYEFFGLQHKDILRNLKQKYGPGEYQGGRFVSDFRYRWRQDGISIELSSDWQNYRTRLIYIDPENMAALQNYRTRLIYIDPENMAALLAERSSSQQPADGSEQISLY